MSDFKVLTKTIPWKDGDPMSDFRKLITLS